VGLGPTVTIQLYLELFQSLAILQEWCLSCHLVR